MAKAKLKGLSTAPDRYLELVRRVPLRPIRSEAELDRAIGMVDELLDRGDLSPEEEDYLDVLGDLVEKYESAAHPLPPVGDAALLRHLIEAREITQAQLAAETGLARSTVSEILAGKRGLNRRHIDLLARFFRISPAAFLGGVDLVGPPDP